MNFNHRQRQALREWPGLLGDLLRRNWRSTAFGYAAGALVASVSVSFGELKSKRDAVTALWKLVNVYVPDVWFVVVPVGIVLLCALGSVAWRAFQSWRYGVATGALFWAFLITVGLFWGRHTVSSVRAVASLFLSVLALLAAAALRLATAVNREKAVRPIRVRQEPEEASSLSMRDPESPIEKWSEDRLGRAALVEVLALKILDSTRTPVIALRGEFGDGKSSVLNLLRLQLANSAVVVSFSSWLPNSELTLASDLFADIAAECNRHFVVPSLRKRLRNFASLLAGSVSYLKALPDVIPTYTQRQEIQDLGEVLGRIPKRLVVLLDEIDRMQKAELLTLLKIIRGAAVLPNVTFVCALYQDHVEKVACDVQGANAHEFFEKFFPTAVDLPKASPDLLQKMLTEQITTTFESGWFKNESEQKEFGEAFTKLWKDAIIHTCTNIRKTALLASDIEAAARLVQGEVSPLDLCALTAVRRFYPVIYETIWTNAAYFSNSYGWWKSLSLRSEEERVAEAEAVVNKIKAASQEDSAVKALLKSMFPARTKEMLGERWRLGSNSDAGLVKAETGKRIAHPDFFPIYFHCEVPETVFSSRELDAFIEMLRSEGTDAARRAAFARKLHSLPEGSVRRYDFIHKMCVRLGDTTTTIEVARPVAVAISESAADLGDDFLVSEHNRAVGGVFAVAERLSGSEEVNSFLAECIEIASSDLFALWLYKFCTTDRSNNQVLRDFHHVKDALIRDAFTQRMNARHNPHSTASPVRSDIHAFSIWAGISKAEKAKEVAFWEAFIGQSRIKLAEAFDIMAPAGVYWAKESYAFIDDILPVSTLRRLYATLPTEDGIQAVHEKALDRLQRFLDDKLQSGEILT